MSIDRPDSTPGGWSAGLLALTAAYPDEATGLLALTAAYPADHPLRQAAARLIARLALAEGKIAQAADVLESADYAAWVRAGRALEILRT